MAHSSRLLYLVRHGATEANLRKPYVLQGQRIDLPLSALGRRQAEAARNTLVSRGIRWCFSSPLRRAIETAEIIAEPHGGQVTPVPELIECDVGRWEGLSWELIRQQDRQACEAFEADPAAVPYAGGESFQQVAARVLPALERLLHDHPSGDLAVVTHNVVGRVCLATWLGLPIANARGIRLDNGGITIVAAGNAAALTLVTLNSVFHLDGLLTT